MKYSGFPRPRLPPLFSAQAAGSASTTSSASSAKPNRVVPQHPSPSHRLRWAGRNVAVGPDGYPLRVDRRRVGLEVTELLLLLGVQPPLTTSLFWRLVEAAYTTADKNTHYKLMQKADQVLKDAQATVDSIDSEAA